MINKSVLVFTELCELQVAHLLAKVALEVCFLSALVARVGIFSKRDIVLKDVTQICLNLKGTVMVRYSSVIKFLKIILGTCSYLHMYFYPIFVSMYFYPNYADISVMMICCKIYQHFVKLEFVNFCSMYVTFVKSNMQHVLEDG